MLERRFTSIISGLFFPRLNEIPDKYVAPWSVPTNSRRIPLYRLNDAIEFTIFISLTILIRSVTNLKKKTFFYTHTHTLYIKGIHRLACHLKNYHSTSFKDNTERKKEVLRWIWRTTMESTTVAPDRRKFSFNHNFVSSSFLFIRFDVATWPRGMIKKKKVDLSEEIVSLFSLSHSRFILF